MGMGVLLPCDNIRRSEVGLRGRIFRHKKVFDSVTTFDRTPVNTFDMDQWFDPLDNL